ncbi:MAG TPA: hypothetical protein VJV76_00050, partial [Gaiellaceae bacterium]|nr:hypothetical protein [Gaiellaceae bacterium]
GSIASNRPLPDGGYRVGVELGSLTAEAEQRLLYHFLANATETAVEQTQTDDRVFPAPQVALNPA